MSWAVSPAQAPHQRRLLLVCQVLKLVSLAAFRAFSTTSLAGLPDNNKGMLLFREFFRKASWLVGHYYLRKCKFGLVFLASVFYY
jgi:hypothetical protein